LAAGDGAIIDLPRGSLLMQIKNACPVAIKTICMLMK